MPMSIAELKAATRNDSRTDILRKMQALMERSELAEDHAAHTDRVILQQNLHLEHTETLVKTHVAGERDLKQEQWERAVRLAHPEQLDEHPEGCPDCGGEIRHAGLDYHVCDSGCGYRYRAEPKPSEG